MRSLSCLIYIPIIFTLTTTACAPRHHAAKGSSANAPAARPTATNQAEVAASAPAPMIEQQIADLTRNLAWTKRLLSNNYALPMNEEPGYSPAQFRRWVYPAEQKAEITRLLQVFIDQSKAKLALEPNDADQKGLAQGLSLVKHFNEAP